MSVQPLIDPQWSWVYAVLVGQQWPQGDEDKLRGAAQAWTDTINGLLDVADGGNMTARNVNYSVRAVSADQFNAYWDQWVNGDNSYVGELAKQCELLASSLLKQAQETEYTKLTINVTVIIVIIQLAAMLVMAAATAGGSLTGWAIAIALGRQAVLEAILRFAEQVIAAVLPDVIAQTIMMADGHESTWDGGKTAEAVAGGVVGGVVGTLAGAAGGKLFGKTIEGIAAETIGGKLGKLAAETALHSTEGALTNGVTSLLTAGGTSIAQSIAAGDSADKVWSNFVTAEGQAWAGLPGQLLSGAGMGATFHLVHAAGSALSPYHGPVTTINLDDGKQVRAYASGDGYKVVDESGFPVGTGTMADDHSSFTLDRSNGEPQTIDLTTGHYSVTDAHGTTTTYAGWDPEQGRHTETYTTQITKTDVPVTNPDGSVTTIKAGSTVTHHGDVSGPVVQADVPQGSSVQRWTIGQDGNLSLAGWQKNTNIVGLGTVHTDYFTANGDKVAGFNGWSSHTDVTNQAAYHNVFSDAVDRPANATARDSTNQADGVDHSSDTNQNGGTSTAAATTSTLDTNVVAPHDQHGAAESSQIDRTALGSDVSENPLAVSGDRGPSAPTDQPTGDSAGRSAGRARPRQNPGEGRAVLNEAGRSDAESPSAIRSAAEAAKGLGALFADPEHPVHAQLRRFTAELARSHQLVPSDRALPYEIVEQLNEFTDIAHGLIAQGTPADRELVADLVDTVDARAKQLAELNNRIIRFEPYRNSRLPEVSLDGREPAAQQLADVSGVPVGGALGDVAVTLNGERQVLQFGLDAAGNGIKTQGVPPEYSMTRLDDGEGWKTFFPRDDAGLPEGWEKSPTASTPETGSVTTVLPEIPSNRLNIEIPPDPPNEPVNLGSTPHDEPAMRTVDAVVLGGPSGTAKSYPEWEPGSKVVAAPEDNRNQALWQKYEKQGRAFRDSENPRAVPVLYYGEDFFTHGDQAAEPEPKYLDQLAADGTLVDAKLRSPGGDLDRKQIVRLNEALDFWAEKLKTPEGRKAWEDWSNQLAAKIEDRIVEELARRSGYPVESILRPKVIPPDPSPPELRARYEISDSGVTNRFVKGRMGRLEHIEFSHVPFDRRADQGELFGDLVSGANRFSVDALIRSEKNGIIDYFTRPDMQGLVEFFKHATIDPLRMPIRFETDRSPNSFDALLYEWDAGHQHGTPSERVKPALVYTDTAGKRRLARFDAYDQTNDQLVDRKLWKADHKISTSDRAEADRQARALDANGMRARWEIPNKEMADKLNDWLKQRIVDGRPLADRMHAEHVPFDRDRVLRDYQQQHPEPEPQPVPAGPYDDSPPGISYLTDPAANRIAANLKSKEGVFYVFAHDELPVEPNQLRQDLLNNGWNGRKAVQFLLCDGAGLENRQAIADVLGVPIGLADGKVWISSSGHYIAGPVEFAANGNFVPTDMTENHWRVVAPSEHQGAPDPNVFLDPTIHDGAGERWQVSTPGEPGAINRLDELRTELTSSGNSPPLAEPTIQEVAAVQLGTPLQDGMRSMGGRITRLVSEYRGVLAGHEPNLYAAATGDHAEAYEDTINKFSVDLGKVREKVVALIPEIEAYTTAEEARKNALEETIRTSTDEAAKATAARKLVAVEQNLRKLAEQNGAAERLRDQVKSRYNTVMEKMIKLSDDRLHRAYLEDPSLLSEHIRLRKALRAAAIGHYDDIKVKYRESRYHDISEYLQTFPKNRLVDAVLEKGAIPPEIARLSDAINARLWNRPDAGEKGVSVRADYAVLIDGYEKYHAGSAPVATIDGHAVYEAEQGWPSGRETVALQVRQILGEDGHPLDMSEQSARGVENNALISSEADREQDAEANAVGAIRAGLRTMRAAGIEPSGSIVLSADKPMCPSCQEFVLDLAGEFPNVVVYVGSDMVSIGQNSGSMYRGEDVLLTPSAAGSSLAHLPEPPDFSDDQVVREFARTEAEGGSAARKQFAEQVVSQSPSAPQTGWLVHREPARSGIGAGEAEHPGWVLEDAGAPEQVMRRFASRSAAQTGVVDLFVHADANGPLLNGRRIGVAELLRLLPRDEVPSDMVIRVVGCDAGGFAARMAKAYDRTVIAADQAVWIDDHGQILAASATVDAKGRVVPKTPPDGVWREFHPDDTTVELAEQNPHRPPAVGPESAEHEWLRMGRQWSLDPQPQQEIAEFEARQARSVPDLVEHAKDLVNGCRPRHDPDSPATNQAPAASPGMVSARQQAFPRITVPLPNLTQSLPMPTAQCDAAVASCNRTVAEGNASIDAESDPPAGE